MSKENRICEEEQCSHPRIQLQCLAESWQCKVLSEEFARQMDKKDPLKSFRGMFHVPMKGKLPEVDRSLVRDDDESVYLCGNSLGLQPKGVRDIIERELLKWQNYGVEGHTRGKMPWALCDECNEEKMAALVGANTEEVGLMNGLSVNLHLLLISFYRPTPTRHKILFESKAFPSDHYAIESQCRLHGYDPSTSMICLEPRKGELNLRTEDILDIIEKEGENIAVICFSGIHYFTGQLFPMEKIAKAGHAKGCYVGFDLAHAVGNVELELHDWGVDFACWCTYKYVNSGAGGIAGAFLHEKHKNNNFPKLLGWWSHEKSTRFQMNNDLDLAPGIHGYRISNPPFLPSASLEASLDVFSKTTMKELRRKSKSLTAYLELLLQTMYPVPETKDKSSHPHVMIITPSDPEERGAQLSVKFSVPIAKVFLELKKRGVVLDKREPDVLRIAPAPLYNSFTDVYKFVHLLGDAMAATNV